MEGAIERVAAVIDSGPETPEPALACHDAPTHAGSEMIAVTNVHGASTRLLARVTIDDVRSQRDFV